MLKLVFVSLAGATLEINGPTLRHCIELSHEDKYNKFEPLYFKSSSGKLFYYDKDIITTYISNYDMSDVELVEHCGCDALFRNNIEIHSGSEIVDNGALWKLVNSEIILIDSERYVTTNFDYNYFNKIV